MTELVLGGILPISEDTLIHGLAYISDATPEVAFYNQDAIFQEEQPTLSRVLFQSEGYTTPPRAWTWRDVTNNQNLDLRPDNITQPTPFRTGIVFAHMFLNYQAASLGKELPPIFEDSFGSVRQDLEDKKKTPEVQNIKEAMLASTPWKIWASEETILPRVEHDAMIHQYLIDLNDEDPYMYQGLFEISRYRADRNHLFPGGLAIYHAIKKALEAQEIAERLKL